MDLTEEIEELRAIAAEDAEMTRRNGVDLNPFSTAGARHLWQQGWDGERPPNLADGSNNWRYWERGRQAQFLAQEPANVSVERPR